MAIPSFNYDYVCLSPLEQIDLHQQPSWELSYVITGSGRRLIGETSMSFTRGDMVLIPPHIPHCWYFNSEDTDASGRIVNISINFQNDLLGGLARLFTELEEPLRRVAQIENAISISGDTATEIADIMVAMREQPQQLRTGGFVTLLALLGNLHSPERVGSRMAFSASEMKLNQVRTYVTCNADHPITLADIARHVGMSRSAFCVFFKKCTGKTFVTYLNNLRLERACELLLTTSLSVAEISYKVGFNDVSHFHRLFRRHFALSPQSLRSCNVR